MKEDFRILKERSELTLDRIIVTDSVSDFIDKINRNFALLREFQGGRQGIKGPQGIPGCSSFSSHLIQDPQEGYFIGDDAKSFCESEIQELDTELIMNEKTERSLLLTNLIESDNDTFRIREYWENDYSSPMVSSELKAHKLKVYNSTHKTTVDDNIGIGNHIHLLNTFAVQENPEFLCTSGFEFSLDKYFNFNTEFLRIKGVKNSSIEEHRHVIELENDITNIQRNPQSQKLRLDPGSEDTNSNSGRIQLQTMNKENVFRLPDRTGWLGVWEDTTDNKEIWEIFGKNDIVIEKSKYKTGGSPIVVTESESMPYDIEDDSYIRFKRLNNWVLIDYNIHLMRNVVEDIEFLYGIFFINTETIGCRTVNWHPGTIVEHSSDEDVLGSDRVFTNPIFRIKTKELQPDVETFSILIKNDVNNPPVFDNTDQEFYLSGQVWATVTVEDSECEPLDIINDYACEPVEIVT